MSDLPEDFALVTRCIRKLRGFSQPFLAEASDGLLYVVKFANNHHGPNLLFNEIAGTELYRACRLPVPDWKPLLVTDSFLDQNPECWRRSEEGPIRPESGLCFGSRFLGGEGGEILQVIPATMFNRIANRENFWLSWLVDICAFHTDNRQAIFRKNAKGDLEVFFIDHGHMFGGPDGKMRPHFFVSHYLDQRLYQSLSSKCRSSLLSIPPKIDLERLWRRVDAIPKAWRNVTAIRTFFQCLDGLSNSGFLKAALEEATRAHRQNNYHNDNFSGKSRIPLATILRTGI